MPSNANPNLETVVPLDDQATGELRNGFGHVVRPEGIADECDLRALAKFGDHDHLCVCVCCFVADCARKWAGK